MSRTAPEKPERERLLLNRRSLETSPPELRQSLAYVLHLRSHWKPEGRAKLIVPTSWMEFLVFADGKCGVECIVNRCCPFRNVRFESDVETRWVGPGEELPRDIVSQLLTNFGMDECLATFVPRAFEGIPRTRLRSDTRHFSQSAPRRIDFALVPAGHGSDSVENASPESDTRCLLLGMKDSEPTPMRHSHSTNFDSQSLGSRILASVPDELTSQGPFHLRHLASLMNRDIGATTESFPEWLVLFGLVYDAHHVRVVAYLPRRRTSDVIECATYIVDELSFHAVTGTPTCGLALECVRFLLALITLRRHVHHLSKSLFTTMGSRDGIKRTENEPSFLGGSGHDQHNSDDPESLNQCASLGSSRYYSSGYSTCASSVQACERNNILVLEHEGELSSCRSFISSSCSSCSSLSEGANTSHSFSRDSKYTNFNYMEPSTISLSQGSNGSIPCPHKLVETKRREIIAWAREVVPTEHPIKDTYRMVIRHAYPRRQRVADFISGMRR